MTFYENKLNNEYSNGCSTIMSIELTYATVTFGVAFNSFEEMVRVLGDREPDGALLDQYSFAAQQDLLGDGILVEGIVESPVQHGIMLSGPDDQLNECIKKAAEQASTAAFMELTKWVTPLTVSRDNQRCP